ncbi:MAG: BamA/TamA family outer membrane protein, partial [Steroidobacteraceae bacterium]
GSDVEFWTASYDYLQFVPIWRSFTLMFNMEIGYGQGLGDTTAMPPYRQFFAGGPDSVRGYRENRLGPQDFYGHPYGGNLRTVAQTELLLPMPEKWRNSARFSLFYDIGNVFSTEDIGFVSPENGLQPRKPIDYDFSYHDLKYSTGIAVQWMAPLGVFRFSYAIPLNAKKGTADRYGDEEEGFQFSIGQAF